MMLSCDITQTKFAKHMSLPNNVLGEKIKHCCTDPMTGYYRDGICQTGRDDYGTHIVCARVTDEFLQFSKSRGNDLTQAIPGSNFPGLKAGDKWCLCISRWIEAYQEGVAPPVDLMASHEKVLQFIDLETLKEYSLSRQ